jgi:hypothetical protein
MHPPSGILKSNVDELEAATPIRRPRRRVGVLVPALLAIIAVVAGAAVFLFAMPSPAPAPRATAQPQPTQQAALAPAAPSGKPGGVPAAMPTVRGISCDALESTLFHIHVHLAIFVAGQEQQVPFGVGVGQPLQVANGRLGPFVEDGSCFYWLHTHTQDGVVHIESPVRRTFTLGDFFAIWQQPLSATQVGPAQGPVIVYLNGARVTTNPADIPLTSHALIQLDVGDDVPPVHFEFAPGD